MIVLLDNNYYQEAHNTSLSHGHGPQSWLCQWCWMSRALELDDQLMIVKRMVSRRALSIGPPYAYARARSHKHAGCGAALGAY